MRHFLPHGADWHMEIAQFKDAPGFEDETFSQLARELDRTWAMGEFERRDPLMRILLLLAGWSGRWEQAGTSLYPRLVALWDPVQSSLRDLLFDLFPGEFTVLSTLPGPRFLTLQNVWQQGAVILYHRASTFVAAAFLHPIEGEPDGTDAVLQIITEITHHLPRDWEPSEIRAYLAGGPGPGPHGPHDAFESTLVGHGVAREHISSQFANRRTESASVVHLAFDRSTGRLASFHPGFSSIDMNLRSREAQNRSVGELSRGGAAPGSIPLRRAE